MVQNESKDIILPSGATGELKITRIKTSTKRKGKKRPIDLIICIPGNSFSGKFMQCWTKLLIYCMNNGINIDILQMYSSNIYHVREAFVSQMVMSMTKNIKPFGGKKYDYTLWIDSDQTFEPEDLEMLIDADQDIVAGAIKVGKGDEFAFGWFDEQIMRERGELLRMKAQDIEGKRALFPVDFCGFAFTLVKRGVFESLKFPYFAPLPYSAYPSCKDWLGVMGEDLSTFYRMKQNGFTAYIHPLVRIGHEKPQIIK